MNSEDLSVKIFKALGHPIRLQIVKSLLNESRCVCEINRDFEYSQANLSQHLKILREAGILENKKIGVEMHYRVKLKGIKTLLEIMDQTAIEYFETLDFKPNENR
ncbi:ArsR/SmtB family transcription factor [Acetobacterium wieringae]|uniref:Winged helix-turn-helix transcriptional regulator n=1 Tax=Acetobacterium wieringae TaxID=52694 RepID=A0A5D0WTK9_9FIRM|nr:metalloregulator ArsR/SmtB family transcription factor [Acetobacterium wieringae]MEA4804889.1 metalloregulator ArsR/SmtB family transcription factor [Acetobacterium wieringae]TYC87088.1 winged helix-turn-helix transcriptional regulator [Acetobacterium wieringae]URN86019.1 metalloregulator ArsR/SmtB family transcription factor [Acetobacterium wieringae]